MDQIEKIRNPYLTEDEKMDIIADALEQGDGRKFVPINVTLNPEQSGTAVDVIADKQIDEVKAIIDAGGQSIVRLSIDQDFEGFAKGVYEIPLVYVGDNELIASTVIGIDYETYYVYSQSSGTYNAKIAIAPTNS